MKRIIIQIAVLLFCVHANAQQAFTNSGNLQIHTGASVSGAGNFTNTSSGTLVNNGSFYVKGNISNDQASMSAGTGILYLNGSSAQAINGTQVFKTFDLTTNNAASISLNNNLSVSGAHIYTAGMITTSATPNYMIYESGSSYSGSGDTRHVNGWVKKIGNTDFSFPVGDATYLRPAGVENLSTVSEFNCHYYTPTPNLTTLSLPIRMIKPNEYWQINRMSGGTASIALNWNHPKVTMDNILVADIRVVHYATGNWNDIGGTASGNTTTTGTISSNAVGAFGSFTLGYTTYPVPLTLISFTGERRSGTSFLYWKTENEQMVDRFEIQRSYGVTGFITLGTVAGRNLGTAQLYNFQDHSPLDAIAYYRLRTVDVDGKFSYSPVIALSDRNLLSSSFVVLNPVKQAITVFNKTGKEGLYDYRLFTASGQLIMKGNINMGASGGVVLPLPLQTAGGIYILELSNEHTQFRQKILVER